VEKRVGQSIWNDSFLKISRVNDFKIGIEMIGGRWCGGNFIFINIFVRSKNAVRTFGR